MGASAHGRRPGSGRLQKHEGQRRADLQVKEGGFALGNFAAENQGKLQDNFEVDEKIMGEGAFGAVRRCKDKRTGAIRAVKSVQKSMVQDEAAFREEMAIMRLLDHPNIVRLFETFEDKRRVYLVMELCTGGELFDCIAKAGKFTEREAAICIQQMLFAVNYLHQNCIMHRDIKPENWLLTEKCSIEKAALKMIDFGISRRFKPGEWAKTKAGTPYYVAPEVLNGRYNERSDLWSVGVICFILLCGQPPFTGKDTRQVLEQVRSARVDFKAKAWQRVSPDGKAMIKALLSKAGRPSAVEALQYPWVQLAKQPSGNMPDLDVEGLRTFSHMNQLKKAAVTVIASQISDARIEAMKKLFMNMDDNADGTLSIAEFKAGLKEAGIQIPDDLDKLLEETDTDGSGVVDYTEFLAATLDKKIYNQEDVCWHAFKVFDADGSGKIDKQELARVLQGDSAVLDVMNIERGEGGEGISKIFNQVDANGDGLIDFDEFMSMMRAAENEASVSPVGISTVQHSKGQGHHHKHRKRKKKVAGEEFSLSASSHGLKLKDKEEGMFYIPTRGKRKNSASPRASVKGSPRQRGNSMQSPGRRDSGGAARNRLGVDH